MNEERILKLIGQNELEESDDLFNFTRVIIAEARKDVEAELTRQNESIALADGYIGRLKKALRKIRCDAQRLTETGGSTIYPDAKTLKNRLDGFAQSILDEVEIALQGEEG